MNVYTTEQVIELIKLLPEWAFKDNSLHRHYEFKNFSEALSFIVQIGIVSEKMNHHAEIRNVYNKVDINLSTHDANAITNLDMEMAKKIEHIYKTYL